MFEITSGVIAKSQKVVIYGPEGVGKSTFASRFPHPVFIDTEGSTANLNVDRLPSPTTWEMLMQEIAYIKDNPICDTLVIDTADWAEKLAIRKICQQHRIDGIEGLGYGKGYVYLEEEFGKLLRKLSELIEVGVNVVLLAHAQIKKFEQPDELGAYDRWELKLQKKTAPLVKEWADMLLFANYKTMVINVDNQGAVKGKNKGQGQRRTIYTEHTAAWDAKNRHGLPSEMDMDFSSIAHIFAKKENKKEAPKEQPQQVEAEQIPPHKVVLEQAPAASEKVDIPFDVTDHGEEVKDKNFVKEIMDDFNRPVLVSHQGLNKLLVDNSVSVDELCNVVEQQGYYSKGTPINAYDPQFIDGVLVGAWSQVYNKILENRKAGNANEQQLF